MERMDKIANVLDLIFRYGGSDGAHHKQWVIDQVVRMLAENYEVWVERYEGGQDGPKTYSWDEGIAP